MNTTDNTSANTVTLQTSSAPQAKLPLTPENYPRQFAYKKLKAEKEKENDPVFADPILSYLMERVKEDYGLSEDILQAHKTWKKCFSYIMGQAQKMKDKSDCVAVRDDLVYEWAEDYYHLDDKAEEEKKSAKEAEMKRKMEELKAKKASQTTGKTDLNVTKTSAVPKQTHKDNDCTGQISLFDSIGG